MHPCNYVAQSWPGASGASRTRALSPRKACPACACAEARAPRPLELQHSSSIEQQLKPIASSRCKLVIRAITIVSVLRLAKALTADKACTAKACTPSTQCFHFVAANVDLACSKWTVIDRAAGVKQCMYRSESTGNRAAISSAERRGAQSVPIQAPPIAKELMRSRVCLSSKVRDS